MEGNNVHYRHILLFYFKKGKRAAEVHKKICSVYGAGALTERVCQKWFAKFRSGDFDLSDVPRAGRPTEVDLSVVKDIIDKNPSQTVREIAAVLNISHTSAENHLHNLGYVSKLNVWVPHKLTEANMAARISICDSLRRRQENDPFFKRMITGDEKWVTYDNVVRKRSWGHKSEPPKTTSKAGLHTKKIMLSVWWDYKGVVHYEVLPSGRTIDSTLYCSQLTRLAREISIKRPELANRKGVVFHHDNAKPHTSLTTRSKLLRLDWDVLPHPPYSPDLAPSDYHLFRSLQNSLKGKTFVNEEVVKRHLDQFFTSKPQEFDKRGIMKLVERWQEVINNKGQYIID